GNGPPAVPVPAAADSPVRIHCARAEALDILREVDPATKAYATRALHAQVANGAAQWDAQRLFDEPPGLPGRPARPELVEPRKLGRRSMQSEEGRAVLLHALAHIEFNAINLALDAVWRFAGMPAAVYTD